MKKDSGPPNKHFNWFICISVLSANMISFLGNAGYPWTSPFLPKLNSNVDPDKNPLSKPLTILEESWITSLHSLGALGGLIITGIISQKFGQKITLIIFSIPMLMSNLMLLIASSVTEFYISRFLLGIGTGAIFSTIPTYIAEITDVANRGKAVMVMPLMAATSHILVVSLGPYVTISTFACISLVPSVLFYSIFVPFVPESPYYYAAQNRLEDAKKSLKKLRQIEDVEDELMEISKTTETIKSKESLKEIITSKTVSKSLLICFGLIFFQQLTGCMPVTAYQQDIFSVTESIIPSSSSVIIVGIFQLLATILVLSIIDKVGRKILFLISYFGLFVSLVGLVAYFWMQERNFNVDKVYWLPLLSIILHMVFFRLGAGPVCWTVVGEIFPSNLKGHLSGIIACEMVILAFVISLIFPTIAETIGMLWTFGIFTIFTGLGITYIWFLVPEIKGKSFTEIQEMLKK